VNLTRSRTAVPLVALLTSAVLAMVLAAQTSLACTDKVALPMPPGAMPMMPGMDMSSMPDMAGGQAMMICPVVLALIVASALLTLSAIVMLWRDPHRVLTQRAIVSTLAQLPVVRTAAALLLGGGSAVAAMIALEHAAPALPATAMLIALLVLCSLVASAIAIVAGRVARAFGRRLILAIVAAVANVAEAAAPCAARFVPIVAGGHAVPLLAAGRGLRAPPPFVR
jgi:hypothetical protein